MVFTIFQYSPLFEDETSLKKLELTKKMLSHAGCDDSHDFGDDGDNENSESEDWSYFCTDYQLKLSGLLSTDSYYIHHSQSFCNYPPDKSTPPPKI